MVGREVCEWLVLFACFLCMDTTRSIPIPTRKMAGVCCSRKNGLLTEFFWMRRTKKKETTSKVGYGSNFWKDNMERAKTYCVKQKRIESQGWVLNQRPIRSASDWSLSEGWTRNYRRRYPFAFDLQSSSSFAFISYRIEHRQHPPWPRLQKTCPGGPWIEG